MGARKRRGTGRVLLLGAAAILLILLFALALLVRRNVSLAALTGDPGAAVLTLPAGFEATIFAEGLNGPRFLTAGPDGALYVADRGNNRIVALADDDGNGQADEILVFAADLPSPHSIVFHEGAFYVGVPTGVIRLVDSDGDRRADEISTLIDDIPGSGTHSTRTVAFLPDGRLVLSVGSTCNACVEEDWRRATVLIYDPPQAGGEQRYAGGLRNAVGLAIEPSTGALWATNNGRDLLGDDIPPDTLHRVVAGGDYGWPFCHAGTIPDPQLGGPDACAGVPKPALAIQAHSAPLGLAFYDGAQFPAEYNGDLFMAYHGSWNRREPTGYKVVRVPFADGAPSGGAEDFATGWLTPDGAVGRPVGVAVGGDGALYVSDDRAGLIYRIAYVGDQ